MDGARIARAIEDALLGQIFEADASRPDEPDQWLVHCLPRRCFGLPCTRSSKAATLVHFGTDLGLPV